MLRGPKSIYIIGISVFGLLVMQAMWLYYAINRENNFLNNNTRQAAIETLMALEQKEDANLIISSLDTIFKSDIKEEKSGKKHKIAKSEVKVIVNTTSQDSIINIENIVDDRSGSSSTAYIYSSSDNGKKPFVKVVKTTNDVTVNDNADNKTKSKLKNYELLLKKIVRQSDVHNLKIESRIKFEDLLRDLKKNLLLRGVSLTPEVAVMNKQDSVVFKTTGYNKTSGIVLPMFARDIVFQNYTLNLYHPSTLSYVFKKAIGVVALSLAVTLLLILVIIVLYRSMLTERKLNQYKNDFINNLTHELKTPLATISLANTNIAKMAEYSKSTSFDEYTRIIDEENKKLNHHIEKVFELSLLEKEKQILNVEKANAHELLDNWLNDNREFLKSKHAQLRLNLNAGKSTVKADVFHFKNVITNLVENAIKYSERVPEISIDTYNREGNLIIHVKDNGIGISKEHQKYIFDKFFRVTNKDLHTTKGFGIGLSYVKQTIELFNGTVAVNSELNKGSEFIITIPYAES